MKYFWWSYVKSIIRRYKTGDTNEAERNAVNAAIDVAKERIYGDDMLKVIELVFWNQTHTLEGAALQIPCCWRTAQRWQSEFIMEVARNFNCNGLIKEKMSYLDP